MPLTPAFTFRLDDQILEGTVCVGVYDGKRPTLTAATTGGKIFMWDPYGMEGDGDGEAGGGAQTAGTASTANKHVRYLNINKKITAVTAGRLGGGASEFGTRDVLFVGTGTDVLAYDVRKNRDVFFKDAPEGVTSLRTKTHGDAFDSVGSTTVNPRGVDESILLVGGNCSLQGFDSNGDEVFWTVADDVVRSVCVFKPCDDLVVFGGDDGSIKAIQLARVGYAVREVFELKESHAVSHLVPLTDATSTSNSKNQTVAFAYTTKDGAIGVYSNETRVWQEKRGAGKRCTCVVAHDLTGDGAEELIFGYADGTVEARTVHSGAVLWSDKFDAPLSAIVKFPRDGTPGEGRVGEGVGGNSGNDDLLACALSGEVRGYRTLGRERGGTRNPSGVPFGSVVGGATAGEPGEGNGTATVRAYGFDGGDVGDGDEPVANGNDEGKKGTKKTSKFAALLGLGGGVNKTKTGDEKATTGAPETNRDLAANTKNAKNASLKPQTRVSAERLESLNAKKQALLGELASYEKDTAALDRGDRGVTSTSSAIPPDTRVFLRLQSPVGGGGDDRCAGGELFVGTNNDCVIKGLILVNNNGASLFPGNSESRYVKFDAPGRDARVPIVPPQDDRTAVDISVKVFVSVTVNAHSYHVFEETIHVPSFWGWTPLNVSTLGLDDVPIGSVTFAVPAQPARVAEWLDHTFRTNCSKFVVDDTSDVRCAFAIARDGTRVIFELDATRNVASIRADTMADAGVFVDAMCVGLELISLKTEVDFPIEMEEFGEVLRTVEMRDQRRATLIAETAESSNQVKALIIHAEDSRILRDLAATRTAYGDLFDMNKELMVEHAKRFENHADLVGALTQVNKMIQRASKCRFGKHAAAAVKAMRKAVKEKNTQKLFRIVRFGGDAE